MHQSLRFLLAALAVWRVTHLLAHEDGPWKLLRRTRRAATAFGAGELVTCFYCLSVWIALPAGWFVGDTWLERAVAWLGASAAAILLERVTATSQLSIEETGDELLQSTGRQDDDTSVGHR
jgi:hypothetical protein